MTKLYVTLSEPLAKEEIRSRSWRNGANLALLSAIIGCSCAALWAFGKDKQVADMDPTISMGWNTQLKQQVKMMPFMQQVPNRNFMQRVQAPDRVVPVRRVEVYSGDGSYTPLFSPSYGKTYASGSGIGLEPEDICTMEASDLMVCDMEGLSPEQQAFMRRKLEHKKMMGGLAPSPSSGASQSPAPAPGQYSPEQLAFLERKRAREAGPKTGMEPEDICEMEKGDVMVCDMEGLSPEQQAFMRRKLGMETMDGGLDTHGRPRR